MPPWWPEVAPAAPGSGRATSAGDSPPPTSSPTATPVGAIKCADGDRAQEEAAAWAGDAAPLPLGKGRASARYSVLIPASMSTRGAGAARLPPAMAAPSPSSSSSNTPIINAGCLAKRCMGARPGDAGWRAVGLASPRWDRPVGPSRKRGSSSTTACRPHQRTAAPRLPMTSHEGVAGLAVGESSRACTGTDGALLRSRGAQPLSSEPHSCVPGSRDHRADAALPPATAEKGAMVVALGGELCPLRTRTIGGSRLDMCVWGRVPATREGSFCLFAHAGAILKQLPQAHDGQICGAGSSVAGRERLAAR